MAVSYSDDHAELARQLHAIVVDPSGICSRAGYALEALLAENAALRGENEHVKKLRHQAIDRSRLWEIGAIKWETRATEAERKLAEAVGLLREALGDMDRRVITAETCNRIDYFISKEAERG